MCFLGRDRLPCSDPVSSSKTMIRAVMVVNSERSRKVVRLVGCACYQTIHVRRSVHFQAAQSMCTVRRCLSCWMSLHVVSWQKSLGEMLVVTVRPFDRSR